MNKDLTTGKPEKVLWQFCLPLFGSIIFQQLYNIADSFVAGKFISDNALAAVGNSYEITLIFIAFAFGCNIACSVLAALFFGAKQYNDLKTTVYTALISSCVICAVLMLVGTLCCDSLLRLIKTPEEVFADSKLYLDIYIYGLPFVFLYNVATGIFSALGDSKTPFIFLACSSTSNIAVDILFVTAFNMGVARNLDPLDDRVRHGLRFSENIERIERRAETGHDGAVIFPFIHIPGNRDQYRDFHRIARDRQKYRIDTGQVADFGNEDSFPDRVAHDHRVRPVDLDDLRLHTPSPQQKCGCNKG